MRKCEDCQIILDGSVRFCPKCGKQMGESGPAAPRAVASLLASANLHRIRQEWDEAVGDATEALKLEPKNADIASILADIYEQRGMLEDALIWCQMSLEMNAHSPAEVARQDRLMERVRGRSASEPDSYSLFQKRLKTGVMVAAGFLLVAAVAVGFIWGGRGSGPANGTLDNPVQRQTSDRVVGIGPGAVTPPTGGRSTRVSPSIPLAGQATVPQAGVRTPGEAKVKTDIQAAQGGNLLVDDAIADPRQGVLVVTFAVPGAGITREAVLAGAAGVARSAFAASPEVSYVTARCLAASTDPNLTRIVFVGDIARTASDSLGDNPSQQALAAAFTGQWWNPQLR